MQSLGSTSGLLKEKLRFNKSPQAVWAHAKAGGVLFERLAANMAPPWVHQGSLSYHGLDLSGTW